MIPCSWWDFGFSARPSKAAYWLELEYLEVQYMYIRAFLQSSDTHIWSNMHLLINLTVRMSVLGLDQKLISVMRARKQLYVMYIKEGITNSALNYNCTFPLLYIYFWFESVLNFYYHPSWTPPYHNMSPPHTIIWV